jgi:TATA-box binding protein (TBP) (component of TFIID and TFIIIB)
MSKISLPEKIPDFSSIPISAQTYNCYLGSPVNIGLLARYLPIYPYNPPKKSRGRRKKGQKAPETTNFPPSGMIVTTIYGDQVRGAILKPKTSNRKRMLNQMSVYIMAINKFINIMVFVNGILTITGSKSEKHMITAIKWLCRHIKVLGRHIECYTSPIIKPSDFTMRMTNITYSIPFEVDRTILNMLLNRIESPVDLHPFISVYDAEMGAVRVGVNEPRIPSDPSKKKQKMHTFLVYASGKVMMSGPKYEYMEDVFYRFNSVLMKHRELIEEKIE